MDLVDDDIDIAIGGAEEIAIDLGAELSARLARFSPAWRGCFLQEDSFLWCLRVVDGGRFNLDVSLAAPAGVLLVMIDVSMAATTRVGFYSWTSAKKVGRAIDRFLGAAEACGLRRRGRDAGLHQPARARSRPRWPLPRTEQQRQWRQQWRVTGGSIGGQEDAGRAGANREG